MAESPLSTPKRKRSEMLSDGVPTLDTNTQFTFDLNSSQEDGNASPRTRVAHRFRGLALGGGGGVNGPSADLNTVDTVDNDVGNGSRKRIRLPDIEMVDADPPPTSISIPPTQAPHLTENGFRAGGRGPSPKSVRIALDDGVVEQSETVANTGMDADDSNTSTPGPSSPLAARPPSPFRSQPRPRPFRRAGTPPLPTTTKPRHRSKPKSASPPRPAITDPLRASLTWHDDEITIYDPDDSDDDGTGINGIGFKPTPAIAYARTVRRRQQLAEYRKREEREARAKRSLNRRRGRSSSPAPTALALEMAAGRKEGKAERRRVRFLESQGGAELIGV
ncbi:hypothetical protein C8A03DRAFT_18408 [Achaetomium macrosporum]|uniref:Uncharacterized protein n=1 Tax=Achaetomium macrosporum TaxID=79813 RepID=A0AAN7C3K0_9PEZI|nr:hypothetical protein C8A03DRAFT_18408 [Achaetomium macrosporum]